MQKYKSEFDEFLILDRLPLTGKAISELIDNMFGKECSFHITDIEALKSKIAVCYSNNKKTLIISELSTEIDSLNDCINLLRDICFIQSFQANIHCLIYTAVKDPIILREVLKIKPNGIVLRTEPLTEFKNLILKIKPVCRQTILSLMVSSLIFTIESLHLTTAEFTWLISQVDGLNVVDTSNFLSRDIRTISHHRRAVMLKVGIKSTYDINIWLGKMQCSLGNYNGSVKLAPQFINTF